MDCHKKIMEENMDFGNGSLSSKKEDKSCRVLELDATITAAKVA